ncbi:MAG TPA: hypothetical protein ENG92_04740, partial [Thiolapillus brandeum]|nr:hypothetical protein [Thiolapillus brandeum]
MPCFAGTAMYKNYHHCRQQLHTVEAIDYYLATALSNAVGEQDNAVLLHSILLLSKLLREGHSCLKLQAEAGRWHWQSEAGEGGFRLPDLDRWQQLLKNGDLAPEAMQPLVYEYQRLYLRRYWTFEKGVADRLRVLMTQPLALDQVLAAKILQQLFPDAQADDQQRLAVANAMGAHFSVISGGPGTGKTFTVTKLLAALQRLN